MKTQKTAIQPLLLVIGEVSNIKSISIYFDGIRYPILKTLSAIDILLKLMFVFNLEYPLESEKFYVFIQTFFYEIACEEEISTKISTITHELMNWRSQIL